MQNKNKLIKKKNQKKKQNKKHQQDKKFKKNQPALKNQGKTDQDKKITSSNRQITKTINRNIEKTMMERANIAKEKFKFFK